MQWYLNRPIAHRGSHRGTEIPENSMRAFEESIRLNHPIELDIFKLVDQSIAVFHDETLKRVTGVDGKISDQSSSDLKRLKLFGTDQTIPLLDDVLNLVQGKVPILIEIKEQPIAGQIEPILWQKLSNYSGDYAIQSFNPNTLAWFKKNAPTVTRGQLSGNFKGENLEWYKKLILSNLLLNPLSQPHFVAYDLKALPNVPTAIARNLFKVPIIAWTIRTQADREKAAQCADNIIFDEI
jgi:glycerophosphoryl diester phosphodiesterase